PSGWDATAAHAPIAAQWNLDIPTLRSWLEPCLGMLGADVAALDATVARPAFFAHQLDRIPLRGTLERARTFGGHKGYSLTIPFAATIEYVLEDRLVVAALGEGVVARLVA